MQSAWQYSSLGFNTPPIEHVVPRSTHELVEMRAIFRPGVAGRAKFLSEPQRGDMTQPFFGTAAFVFLGLAARVRKEPGAVFAARTWFLSGTKAVVVFVVTTFLNTDGLVTSALSRLVLTQPVGVVTSALIRLVLTPVLVDVVVSQTSDAFVSWSADERMLSNMTLQIFLSEVVLGRFDHDQASPS